MNLNALLEVLNGNKEDKFVVVGMKNKVTEAVVADNLVKVTVTDMKKKHVDTVANVLEVLGKVDAGAAGGLEVTLNGKVLASAEATSEDYVVCKVS